MTATKRRLIDEAAEREKLEVALVSLLAAVGLTALKLGVGLWTNSLGLLAEALHSGLDLMAAALTLWAVRMSARPADVNHTYGHGKFENLSALAETLLLLVTCLWIGKEAMERLFFKAEFQVDANIWAFLVVIVSVGVDYRRSRALRRAAKKYQSQALEADALHFSTDIWSSAVVLLGLLGVEAATWFGVPWLKKADALAALAVALIVVWVSLRLGRKSIDDLLDAVPKDLQEKVRSLVAQVPGVEDVKQVRVRKSGAEIFADITLSVWHTVEFSKTHEIADQAEASLRRVLPGVDVIVHVEPAGKAGLNEAPE